MVRRMRPDRQRSGLLLLERAWCVTCRHAIDIVRARFIAPGGTAERWGAQCGCNRGGAWRFPSAPPLTGMDRSLRLMAWSG